MKVIPRQLRVGSKAEEMSTTIFVYRFLSVLRRQCPGLSGMHPGAPHLEHGQDNSNTGSAQLEFAAGHSGW